MAPALPCTAATGKSPTCWPRSAATSPRVPVMTEAAIDAGLFRDLYVAMGEPVGTEGAWAIRLHYKPMVRWMWLGATGDGDRRTADGARSALPAARQRSAAVGGGRCRPGLSCSCPWRCSSLLALLLFAACPWTRRRCRRPSSTARCRSSRCRPCATESARRRSTSSGSRRCSTSGLPGASPVAWSTPTCSAGGAGGAHLRHQLQGRQCGGARVAGGARRPLSRQYRRRRGHPGSRPRRVRCAGDLLRRCRRRGALPPRRGDRRACLARRAWRRSGNELAVLP
jgi:hypothetical protein